MAALSLTGCGTLIPKRVELFQDKVKEFPEHAEYAKELQRQLVQRLQARSTQTVQAALLSNAGPNVLVPAKEVQELARAEAAFVGPPEKRASETTSSGLLARKLETSVARFNQDIEDFRVNNNENAGKKIEGTGLIRVPYLLWIGGIAALLFVAYFVGKIMLSIAAVAHPGAALGLNVVNAASGVVTKGFSQLVKGGENFKDWIADEIQDVGLRQKILDAFRVKHEQAQDDEVQNTVRAITK
jgi:hypothetical protein